MTYGMEIKCMARQGTTRQCIGIGLGLGMEIKENENQGKPTQVMKRLSKYRHGKPRQGLGT
jgi:hypothetical protein